MGRKVHAFIIITTITLTTIYLTLVYFTIFKQLTIITLVFYHSEMCRHAILERNEEGRKDDI